MFLTIIRYLDGSETTTKWASPDGAEYQLDWNFNHCDTFHSGDVLEIATYKVRKKIGPVQDGTEWNHNER